MPRYTDKDALYKEAVELEEIALAKVAELVKIPFAEMTKEEWLEFHRWTAILNERSAFKFDIADAPIADVQKVKQGRWISDEDGNIECSVCGYHGVGDLYCERCGADMREETNDADNNQI